MLLNQEDFFLIRFRSDRYAIFMIPSSLIAFQVMTAILGSLSLIAGLATSYLLGFHFYLCKSISKIKITETSSLSYFVNQVATAYRLTITLLTVGRKVKPKHKQSSNFMNYKHKVFA